MKLGRLFATITLIVIGFVARFAAAAGQASGPGKEDTEKGELEKLQGKWVMVSLMVSGKASPDMVAGQAMVVKGTKSTYVYRGKEGSTGSLRIDPGKNPAHYDVTYENGPAKGITLNGVYKLEGDVLTIHLPGDGNEKRPADFTSRRGSGTLLLVFKRAEPSDK